MPFNFQVFRTRALSSVIFVAVMLAGLLIDQWTFLLLFSVIHFASWSEYQKLVGLIDKRYNNISFGHKYGIMLLGWGFMFRNTNDAFNIGNLAFFQAGNWIMALAMVVIIISEITYHKRLVLKNIGYSLFGLVYISLSAGLMINLRSGPSVSPGSFFDNTDYLLYLGLLICMAIVVSVWINDTMAYIVGSFIGRTPFSKISPKKTWEGTIGGAVFAVITVPLIAHLRLSADYLPFFFISFITTVFGIIGDLLESKLKRMAAVKESGSFLPGHGGFLDRFDSLLVATPFVWLYVKLFI